MACPEPHRLTLRAEAVSGTHRLEVEPHTAAHLSRGRPGWCLGRRLNIALAVVPLESGQSRNMEHMIFVFLSFFLVEVRVVFFFFFPASFEEAERSKFLSTCFYGYVGRRTLRQRLI